MQTKVSERHSSVEQSKESDVMATAEVLATSATEGVSVVMETAALSTGVLSLSMDGRDESCRD